jgi:hypothetical protein
MLVELNWPRSPEIEGMLLSSPMLEDSLNVALHSRDPLVVTGISDERNYLEYASLKIDRGISSIWLRVQGRVTGEHPNGCLAPRIVLWNKNDYLGETSAYYYVESDFDVAYRVTYLDKATQITPRVSFNANCFSKNYQIRIDKAEVYGEQAP